MQRNCGAALVRKQNPKCGIKRVHMGDIITMIASFRLQYEDDYEYEVTALSMRFRLAGPKFLKCACSTL